MTITHMEGLLNSDTRNDINIATLRFNIDTKKWVYVKSLLWNKQLFLSSSFHRRMVPGKATSTVGARWLAQKGYAPDLCLESLGCFFCVSSLLKKMLIYGTSMYIILSIFLYADAKRKTIYLWPFTWRTHNYQEPCAHPKWERQGLGESPAYYWAPATMGLKQIIGWVDRHQPPWLLKETTSARSLPSCSFLIVLGFWMLS